MCEAMSSKRRVVVVVSGGDGDGGEPSQAAPYKADAQRFMPQPVLTYILS